jgi:hypothetical protein
MARTINNPRTSQITHATTNTSSTASGNPGPGRTIDDFLSFLGRRLERFVEHVIERWYGGPNVIMSRMLLLQAGEPTCPCVLEGRKRRSTTSLDPKSVVQLLLRFSSFHCRTCLTSYQDMLSKHESFGEDCIRLVACIRCVIPLHLS